MCDRHEEHVCTGNRPDAHQDVKLGAELMDRVELLINQRTVVGSRYNAQANSEVDTETF